MRRLLQAMALAGMAGRWSGISRSSAKGGRRSIFSPVSAKRGELVFASLILRRTSETEMEGVIRLRYGPNDVREETLRYRRAPL